MQQVRLVAERPLSRKWTRGTVEAATTSSADGIWNQPLDKGLGDVKMMALTPLSTLTAAHRVWLSGGYQRDLSSGNVLIAGP